MFLSRLLFNPRSRQVRRDLAQPYEMHRTLMRAFPGQSDGGPGRVLFRIDTDRDTGASTALIQSEKRPDWSALPPDYLTQPAEVKTFAPAFTAGQRLLFRLRANPTRKTGTSTKADRLAGKPRSNGTRQALMLEDQQHTWLRRKAEAGGFKVLSCVTVPEGFARGQKAEGTLSHYTVRFDGLLSVTDPERFLQTVHEGIGPAKGFGFGLLSLARAEG
jgi:CRISPR system Cascade subunit CasE